MQAAQIDGFTHGDDQRRQADVSAARLLDRHGLAGEGRLLRAQRGGVEAQHAKVRRHAVAGVQLYDVARHQLPGQQVRHLRGGVGIAG